MTPKLQEHRAADLAEGPVQPVAYDVFGAATASGFGRNVIYDAMNSGALVARKYGRRTVIMREDLIAWLKSLPVRDADKVAA